MSHKGTKTHGKRNTYGIDDIGEEIGHKFEIIIAAKENSSYDSLLFSDLERKIEHLTIVRVRTTNQGMAKRIATNLSSGKYLVFFDSSLSKLHSGHRKLVPKVRFFRKEWNSLPYQHRRAQYGKCYQVRH